MSHFRKIKFSGRYFASSVVTVSNTETVPLPSRMLIGSTDHSKFVSNCIFAGTEHIVYIACQERKASFEILKCLSIFANMRIYVVGVTV